MTDQSCIRYAGFPELEGAVRLTQNVNGEARSQRALEVVPSVLDTDEKAFTSIVPIVRVRMFQRRAAVVIGIEGLDLFADVLSA